MNILRLIAGPGFPSVIAMDELVDTKRDAAVAIDALDVQLLNIIQADNLMTAEALCRIVPLSPSSALRRLGRLREAGLIAREAAVLSETFLARRASGLVLVKLTRQTPDAVRALKQQLAGRGEVQLIFEISGAYDLMLLIVERDIAAFHAFTAETLATSPHVQRFEISFVKSRLKATLALPLDARDTRR